MTWLTRYASSSIGKKQIVAVTGLAMALFLVAHLAGNLLIFVGPEMFNAYSHALISNPAIYLAEGGLVLVFLVHILFTLKLTRENAAARPVAYAIVGWRGGPSRRSLASQTMIYSGALVAAFAVLHVKTFKYGAWYAATYAGHPGVEMRDIYKLVVATFHEPIYVGWYVLAMVVLGLHLSHGVSSLFETLGADHPRWTPLVLKGGKALAWAIALGFASLPIIVMLTIKVTA